MINGKPTIDVEEIRAYTIFQGAEDFGDNHPQVKFIHLQLHLLPALMFILMQFYR